MKLRTRITIAMPQGGFVVTRIFTGGVALVALLTAGCGFRTPLSKNPFSDPDARLLFEACERPADTGSVLGPAGGSGAQGGWLAVGSVVDLRPQGDTLYVYKVTYNKVHTSIEAIHLGIFGGPVGIEFGKDTTEVTEFRSVVARPRMDSVLLADMRRLLEQQRIDTDTAVHEQVPLLLDMWLMETQIRENMGGFIVKIEGKVGIDVRVRDVETRTPGSIDHACVDLNPLCVWERSFTAVDTVGAGVYATRGEYRRALSNAYCRALDMIKTALDSDDVRQAVEERWR